MIINDDTTLQIRISAISVWRQITLDNVNCICILACKWRIVDFYYKAFWQKLFRITFRFEWYDKKHCKTLSEVSINSNEKQSQNKNRTLYFTGSKTSCAQIEEMLNNQRPKKLLKKLSKSQKSSPKDGTNSAEILIEKME